MRTNIDDDNNINNNIIIIKLTRKNYICGNIPSFFLLHASKRKSRKTLSLHTSTQTHTKDYLQ